MSAARVEPHRKSPKTGEPNAYNLSPEEVAVLLGLDHWTRPSQAVMRLVRDEGLPCKYVSVRRPRFSRVEVLTWLRAQERSGPKRKGRSK